MVSGATICQTIIHKTRSQKRFIKKIIAEFALFTWSLVTLYASKTKSTVFALFFYTFQHGDFGDSRDKGNSTDPAVEVQASDDLV